MNEQAKHEVREIFREDISAIKHTIGRNIEQAFAQVREEIREERGLKQTSAEIEAKEIEINRAVVERMELMRRYDEKLEKLRQERDELKTKLLGEGGSSPSTELLVALGINARNEWNGIKVHTQLDALACERLSKRADLTEPYQLISEVERSVYRELTFANNLQQMYAVYERFHALNFQRFGVEIPRKLDVLRADPRFKGLKAPKQKALKAKTRAN